MDIEVLWEIDWAPNAQLNLNRPHSPHLNTSVSRTSPETKSQKTRSYSIICQYPPLERFKVGRYFSTWQTSVFLLYFSDICFRNISLFFLLRVSPKSWRQQKTNNLKEFLTRCYFWGGTTRAIFWACCMARPERVATWLNWEHRLTGRWAIGRNPTAWNADYSGSGWNSIWMYENIRQWEIDPYETGGPAGARPRGQVTPRKGSWADIWQTYFFVNLLRGSKKKVKNLAPKEVWLLNHCVWGSLGRGGTGGGVQKKPLIFGRPHRLSGCK